VPDRRTPRFSFLVPYLTFLAIFSGLALFVAYQSAASYRVDISEARSTAELEGVYLSESNDQFGPYRWTPGQITIHLRPIGGPLHVRIRLAGWRPDNAGNPPVVFTLDGHEVARAQTSNSAQDIDITITRGQALLSTLDLQLQTPTFKFGSDPRELGVVLIGVEASSGAEWPKPAVPNGVVLWQTLLGALFLFGAGRVAGWKGTNALIVTCCAVALMALMFALDRERYAQWTWVWLVLTLLALALGLYWRQLSLFAVRCVSAIRQGILPDGNCGLRIASYDEPDQSAVRPLPRFLPPLLVFAALAITLLHPLIALLPRDIIDTTSFSTDYTNFSWGLAYYAALPAWLSWGGIVLVFIFAIPQVNSRVTGWLS